MSRKKLPSTISDARADLDAERQRIEAQARKLRNRPRKASAPRPLGTVEQIAERGVHLGSPNKQQLAKPGASYELAPPEYDGDIRTRRRWLLTPPWQRAESVRAALIKADETGRNVDDILSHRDTPLDKVLGPSLTPAINWYIGIHVRVLNGRKPVANYSGASTRSDPGGKLALQPDDERDRSVYAFVNRKLKPHEKEFLHICAIVQFPDSIDLTVHNVVVNGVAASDMTRAEIGKLIIGRATDAPGGFDGYCKAVTISLNDIMLEYSITEMRQTSRKMREEQDARRRRVLGMEPVHASECRGNIA